MDPKLALAALKPIVALLKGIIPSFKINPKAYGGHDIAYSGDGKKFTRVTLFEIHDAFEAKGFQCTMDYDRVYDSVRCWKGVPHMGNVSVHVVIPGYSSDPTYARLEIVFEARNY